MERYNLISVVLTIGYLAIWLLAIFGLTQTSIAEAESQLIKKSEVIKLIVGRSVEIPLLQRHFMVERQQIIYVKPTSDDKISIAGIQPGVASLDLSKKIDDQMEVTNYRIYVYEGQEEMVSSPSPLPPPSAETDPFDIAYVHSVYPTAKLKSELNLMEPAILLPEILEILGGDSSRYRDLKALRMKAYQLPNTDLTTSNFVLQLYQQNLEAQGWRYRFGTFTDEGQTIVLVRKEDRPSEAEVFIARTKLPNTLIVMRMEGMMAGVLPLPTVNDKRPLEDKKSESVPWQPFEGVENLPIDKLETIIEKGAGEVTEYAVLAAKYEQIGEYAKALELYNSLLDKFPEASEWFTVRAEYGKAKCYESLGKKDEALKVYKKVIDQYNFEDIEGDYVALSAASIVYLRAVFPLNREFIRSWRNVESNLIDRRDYETSLRQYQNLITPDVAAEAAKFLMIGVCHQRLDNLVSEIVALKQSLEKRPSGFAMYLLGIAYQEQRDYERAINQYENLLSQHAAEVGQGHIAEASYRLGRCLEQLKKQNEALSAYEKFIAKYMDEPKYSHLIREARLAIIGIRRMLGQLPFLGVLLRPDANGKVKVAQVIANSPAERVGIKEGDEIVAIDSKPMLSTRMVAEETATRKIGDKIVVTILREGKKLDVPVELGRMEPDER